MTEILVPGAIITLLVLANGLFVAAEFAIVGASRATIEHLASQGNRLARRVQPIVDQPRLQDRFIATAQIGITLASLGLGMYGEHVIAAALEGMLARWAANPWIASHVIASILSVSFLTYLHIVIGEMVPKALALQHPAGTVLWVSPLMLGMQRAILPLVIGLNALGNALLRVVGIERGTGGHERYHTTEELQYIIEESQEGGLLREDAGQILRDLFQFGDLTAGEVMVPRVLLVGIPLGAEPDELRAIVRGQAHTRYPVYSGDLDNIVGSLHIKQVLRLLLTNRPVTIRDARSLPYVPGPTPVDELIASMRRSRAQIAVVMDQHGGTAGLVTIEDLFEEVVGDIEEGRGSAALVREAPDRIRVRGTVRLAEMGEALGCALAHEKATTASGLVLLLLRRPAAVGDEVEWNGARFEVTAVAGRGVAEAIVTRAGAAGPTTPSPESAPPDRAEAPPYGSA